ncbi:hypothetical protein DL769_002924 [Monosporascus sp. CRB-8-3]|nr:hypothetical protein DL769_002924 [Monosporascus sp. CRB-8-3]
MADLNYEGALETARQSEPIATNPGFKALAIAVDVSDRNSVDEMVDSAVKNFPRIDYLVNSAGIGVQKHLPIEDADLTEMDRFWQVNVLGTFNCIQAVTKVMKQQSVKKICSRSREREVGRGVILNLGSCNSYIATPNIVQYTTSKHAVIGLTKNAGMHLKTITISILRRLIKRIALENAAYGIRVNAICPGWVDTPMVDAAIAGNPNLPKMMKTVIPMSRIAQPDEIADVVMFMTCPRSSYVTGVGWLVDGGTTLQLPTY